jgi:hypothetical protein
MGNCVICKQPLTDPDDIDFLDPVESEQEEGKLAMGVIVHKKCKEEIEREREK